MTAPRIDLIGLVGRKGSGKDTAATGLTTRGWQRAAVATPLRNVVKTMFLLDDNHCDIPELKEKPGPLGVSYRRGMQVVGTEMVRRQLNIHLPELGHEGFWIQHMRRRIEHARKTNVRIVITDVRFRDEADAILAMGGKLIHVQRAGVDVSDNHASETGVDDIVEGLAPPVLTNDGTPAQLQAGLQELVEDMEAEQWDQGRMELMHD